MTYFPWIAAFSVALSAVSPALAAQPLQAVDQIAPATAVSLEQLSDGSTSILTSPEIGSGRSVTSPQLGDAAPRSPQATQLTIEPASGRSPVQVSVGGRSADGAASLSRPSEGRRVAVERVAGDDSCDPSRRTKEFARACAAVIEDRAAEFSPRAVAPLSPEERILIEQRRRAPLASSQSAARTLAVSGDAETPELQGIASVVLNRTDRREDRSSNKDTVAERAAAVVEAIVNQGSINVPPPQ